MCGIIGVINANTSISASVTSFMTQGLVASQLRGTDSTGMFQIGNTPRDVYVYKDTVNSSDFINDTTAVSVLRDVDVCPINVAHVRARTQGGVNKDNAHPFTVLKPDNQRLIGVHNGSLTSWKGKKDSDKFEVDSNWALHHIAQNGLKAFEDIHGPYALIWWDESDRAKLYIARNAQRPLHILFSADHSRMLFASEARMLAWIAERTNFVSDKSIREVPTGKLWKFDTSGSKITWEVEDLPSPKYTTTTATTNTHGGGNVATSANLPPIPRAYAILAEQLGRMIQGEEPTVSACLSVNAYSNNHYSGWHGGVDYSDMCYLEDDDHIPFGQPDGMDAAVAAAVEHAVTQSHRTIDSIIDGRLPDRLLPIPNTSGVSQEEEDAARSMRLYGAVMRTEADTYSPRNKQLYAVTEFGGDSVDIVFRNMGKREGTKYASSGRELDCVILGVAEDGTLIARPLTRRMRDFLSQ